MGRILAVFFVLFCFSPPSFAGDVRQMAFDRINAERTKVGRKALNYNEKLEQAAQDHADWMARTEKMTHLQGKKPTGDSREAWAKSAWHPINRVIRAGYLDLEILSASNANEHVGETIAHGKPNSGPDRFRPRSIVDGWVRSEGHRKTMMGDYREVGIGVMITERGDVFWCAVFGNP